MAVLSLVILALFAVRLAFTVVNSFLTPVIRPCQKLGNNPKISVLVRSGNEHHRLGYLLDLMHNLTYPNIEIIIALFRTSRHSLDIVESHAKIDGRFKLLYIDDCKAGWRCANWVNYKLGNMANGNYLLFMDSDVDVMPGIIESLVNYMRERKLSLLSVFPYYELHKKTGKVVYPIFTKLYYMLVPRWSFSKHKDPLFDIAGNNFMIFEGEAYRLFQPFEEVRGERGSATAIVNYYYRERLNMDVIISNRNVVLYGRLTWKRTVVDASKYIIAVFGNNYFAAFLYITINMIWFVPVVLSHMWIVFGIIVFLIVLNHMILSRLVDVKIGESIIFILPQFAALTLLVWFSLLHNIKKRVNGFGKCN